MDNKTIKLISYGTKHGSIQADITYSVKRFPNPYHTKRLRELTGLDQEVKDKVLNGDCRKFIDDTVDYILGILGINKSINVYNRYGDKDVITIAFGCYGGKHRSVVVVEELYKRLKEHNIKVEKEHRDLNR
jgi:UPF0042 nucleotide-binding protein